MRRILAGLLVVLSSLCHAQVSSVFGRTGDVAAGFGDYTAAQVTNAVDSTQTYDDPAWLSALDWLKITNAPLRTDANNNVVAGQYAFFSNTLGQSDVAVGHAALYYNTSGSNNTAVGDTALVSNTEGSFNTAVGSAALQAVNGDGITTAVGNTGVGYQSLVDLMIGNDNTAVGQNAGLHITANYNTAVGMDSQNYNSTGSFNTSLGQDAMWGGACPDVGAPYSGSYNTAIGQGSFCGVTTGSDNTAVGMSSINLTTTGSNNVAIGYEAGLTANSANANVTGSNNTWIGYGAGPGTSDQLTNSTAIGANAVVSQSNALVLGGTGENAVQVGIGTATPSNILTLGQGAGNAIGDGWATYSSRRWKTNIHTLHAALAKVQQLRGVSYDASATGKHEIGVTAEEVGAVVPEVVTWDDKSKEAKGVDYSRLTALLIEAMKEQQLLIDQQQRQIKIQQAQIAQLASRVTKIRASLNARGEPDVELRVTKARRAMHQ